ncbi:MAG TPA: class I SAM-dependent methyltransferase [Pyrinomonadaceae bacterium]
MPLIYSSGCKVHRRKLMSSIEADFDRLALLDDEGWTANNHYHNFLLKYVPENCENALEIGCGTGAFAMELGRRARRVVAIDMSPEMIGVARRRSAGVENVEFELADAMRWEFPKAQFDFVCSIATLHHLEQREILTKINDALRPNGVLVVLDLVESSGLVERMMDVAALGVSAGLRLIHNGRLRPPPEVRKAWEQHGKHDHYSTVRQVRTLADEILPGSQVKRCVFWRYLLTYRKPAMK